MVVVVVLGSFWSDKVGGDDNDDDSIRVSNASMICDAIPVRRYWGST